MNNVDKAVKEALERNRPTSAVDRIAEQALKTHLDARSGLNTHAHRAVMEALEVNSRSVREQFSEPILALRSRLNEVSQTIINQSLTAQKALAAVASYAQQDAFLQSQKLIASAAYNSVLQFQNSHRDMLAGFRSVLDRDLSPALAAVATMRTLGLANISPEFSEYVSETVDVEEPQEIRQTTSEIFEAKSRGLTTQQQFQLMLAATIFQILLSIFQSYQAGRPIKIDPIQLEQLKAHPEITINIYNFFSQVNERVEYEVERKVALKLKPRNCSVTMATLEKDDKVKLVRMSHQWIYVEYHDEEEDLPIFGWVNKKYLKRVR